MGKIDLGNGVEVEMLGTSCGSRDFHLTEKEALAAIIAVEDILGAEGFLLGEKFEMDSELDNGFYLYAPDGNYPGDTAYKNFSNLYEVLKCLGQERIHAEMLEADYKGFFNGDGINWPHPIAEKALILIEDRGYVQDLLKAITPGVRDAMKDRFYGSDEETLRRCEALLNDGPEAAYFKYDDLGRQDFDALGYLSDKLIATKIMDTQSAYDVIEYDGKVCEVYVDNGDISDFKEEIENGTLVVCAFDSYRELIDAQKGMILDDFQDIGLYDDEGNWSFYLTEKELRFIGLSKELAQAKAQENIDVLVENAKERTGGTPAREQEKEVEMG